ncbi:MAG: hypothetical protein K2K93_03840 [Muribaculaceae bacterium]|nr:hypothetical protein [Muribaculaceae bacterium]
MKSIKCACLWNKSGRGVSPCKGVFIRHEVALMSDIKTSFNYQRKSEKNKLVTTFFSQIQRIYEEKFVTLLKNFISMETNNSCNRDFGDDCFASEGHENNFDWYAYANFYDASLHEFSPQINKENSRQNYLASNYGGIRNHIYNSINNNPRFLDKVRNPFVVDTTAYAPGGYVLGEFINALADFFQTGKIINTFPKGTDPWIMYKGKDLIMPLLFCDKEALEFIDWKANQYLENGASSVTIIFVFRIKPSSTNFYPPYKNYPQVTEYSFAEYLNLSGVGNFISQLADAADDNYKNKPKYKLM